MLTHVPVVSKHHGLIISHQISFLWITLRGVRPLYHSWFHGLRVTSRETGIVMDLMTILFSLGCLFLFRIETRDEHRDEFHKRRVQCTSAQDVLMLALLTTTWIPDASVPQSRCLQVQQRIAGGFERCTLLDHALFRSSCQDRRIVVPLRHFPCDPRCGNPCGCKCASVIVC